MKSPLFEIPSALRGQTYIGPDDYQRFYQESVSDPELFWESRAKEFLSWDKTWDRVLEWDYHRGLIKWFEGAKLNVSYNCLDRHLDTRADKVALIWESNNPGEVRHVTYRQLHSLVCKFANVLKGLGVKNGDRVALYMPMVPELVVAMLACTRIGAVHSVIFAGFSAEAVRGRLIDSKAELIVTADHALRGSKIIPLKEVVDQAVSELPFIRHVVVYRRSGLAVEMKPERDRFYDDLMKDASTDCIPLSMDSEDPLFILYTSGSTGKPKGVLHTQAGYLLYASVTHRYIFDYREEDIYFCAADIGWITGHSYIVYGPLANGATTLIFESIPTYPDPGRYWDVVERHRVNIFYTAPTAIRSIAKEGDHYVKKHDLSSLRILGSVGEPINDAAWLWYYNVVGGKRCAIVDTWWQTETGGILISPLPGAIQTKPGSATKPFFGIQPSILDENGTELSGNDVKGRLCINFPWPGQMRTIYGDHELFLKTYFSQFPGRYFTGDACIRDEDGYYWITGRVDDVLIISGHRIGTAELESAIVNSEVVAEAAVVGIPHSVKGIGIFAYCIPKEDFREHSEVELQARIVKSVRKDIGGIAVPDQILFVSGLPKTRSGKIMRRILRKIASHEHDSLGDISTLAEPSIVQEIISKFQEDSFNRDKLIKTTVA